MVYCDDCDGRYSEPFYVGVNNPRFKGISSSGYLPAICPSCPKKEWSRIISPLATEPSHIQKQVDMLKAQVLFLQGRVNRRLDKKKGVKDKVSDVGKAIYRDAI